MKKIIIAINFLLITNISYANALPKDPSAQGYVANPLVISPANNSRNSRTSSPTSSPSATFDNNDDLPLWQKEEKLIKAPWQRKRGVAHYNYGDDPITIHTRVGMPTALTMKGIEIADVQNGSNKMVQTKYTQSTAGSIYITASTPNVDVGLTVISKQGKSYSFTVRTYSIPKSNYYMDREVYVTVPHEDMRSTKEKEQTEEEINAVVKDSTYNRLPTHAKKIPYTGVIATPHAIFKKTKNSDDIVPQRVWQDKNRTYMEFGSELDHPLPVIFWLNGSSEKDVNMEIVDMDHNIVVLDRKGSFILRYNQKVVCVISKNDPLYAQKYQKDHTGGGLKNAK